MDEKCPIHPHGERRPYVVRDMTIPGITYCWPCHKEWCATRLPQITKAVQDSGRVSQGC